jgi:hypothetical protein
MILGWLRLAVVAYAGLTVLYLLIWLYARSLRRERLEKTWDAGEGEGERAAFVEAGMQAWRKGLHQRLFLLIYILPTLAFAAVFYVLNMQ